jgi:PD-(D/E)XK endonuclease
MRTPPLKHVCVSHQKWAVPTFSSAMLTSEEGLAASKPWGDSRSYDCVVGRPGKFVAVQVKCTIARLEKGEGYICSTCSSHKPYRRGAFDYLAAYVIPEDAWYIIPAREIYGLKSISLCTLGAEAKYEPYREAWALLRKASESEGVETLTVPAEAPRFPRNGLERCRRQRIIFVGIWRRTGIRPGNDGG